MDFDLIVIGSGPGGYVAAIRASQLGLKTAIIEKEHLGGVCLNWGCIPTKSLLKSAKLFNDLKKSSNYGLIVENINFDFSKIIKRSRNIVEEMKNGIHLLMKKNNIKIIYGQAELKINKKISVINKQIVNDYYASNIIIATGAKFLNLKNLPPCDGYRIINYKQALSLLKLPKSIVILGSGAIGIEFAYFFNTMGVNVTIIEYLPNILPFSDEEISKELKLNFIKNGVNILTSSYVSKIDIFSSKIIKVFFKKDGINKIIEANTVMYATGIKANINNIGLENIGIKTRNTFIKVDKFYQTNIPGYYSIGDVISTPSLAHVASYEACICVEHIKGLNPDILDYNNIPYCIYSIPEIAFVGYTEKEAIKKGFDIKVGKFPFRASGKSRIDGNIDGFVKVIFDSKYGEWLGCHIIGSGNISELISEVVVSRKLETTGEEIIKSIHPHPTLSESISEAILNAYNKSINI